MRERGTSGNVYKAVVTVGDSKFSAYRASITGAYEGAQRKIEKYRDEAAPDVTANVVIYHQLHPAEPWTPVDTQDVEPGCVVKF